MNVYLKFWLHQDCPAQERLVIMAFLVIVDTQLGQELHEERTVQIFAQLIQHKPKKDKKEFSQTYSNMFIFILPISEFTLFKVGLNSYQFGCWSSEISVHSQIYHMKAHNTGSEHEKCQNGFFLRSC